MAASESQQGAPYALSFRQSVARDLRSVPRKDMAQLPATLQALAGNPRPPGSERLSGQDRYRLRHGECRVVYEVDDAARQVLIVKVAQRRENFSLFFNTVWKPERMSLRYLDVVKLDEIIDYLENTIPAPTNTARCANNMKVYREFINTLRYWRADKYLESDVDLERLKKLKLNAQELSTQLPEDETTALLAATVLCWYSEDVNSGSGRQLAAQLGGRFAKVLHEASLPTALVKISNEVGSALFISSYLDALAFIFAQTNPDAARDFVQKVAVARSALLSADKIDQAALDLATTGSLMQINHLAQTPADELTRRLKKSYGIGSRPVESR